MMTDCIFTITHRRGHIVALWPDGNNALPRVGQAWTLATALPWLRQWYPCARFVLIRKETTR